MLVVLVVVMVVHWWQVDVEGKRVGDVSLVLLLGVVMVERWGMHHGFCLHGQRTNIRRRGWHTHRHAVGCWVALHIARGWKIVQWFLFYRNSTYSQRIRTTHRHPAHATLIVIVHNIHTVLVVHGQSCCIGITTIAAGNGYGKRPHRAALGLCTG